MNGLKIITESVFPSAPNVDREAGIISGVKIIGVDGQRGRRKYGRQTLEKARPLYEGKEVNVDHRVGGGRKLADRFGKLQDVRVTPAGLFGDLHYLKSHPMADRLVECATRPEMNNLCGLSHDARGRTRMVGNVEHCDGIEIVKSVDIVPDPGSVSSLFESNEDVSMSKPPEALAIFKRRDLTPANRKARLVTLVEEEMAVEPEFVPEPPAEPAADAGEMITQGFEEAALAILQDESLDTKEKKKRLAALIDAQATAIKAVEGEQAAESSGGDSSTTTSTETETTESNSESDPDGLTTLIEEIRGLREDMRGEAKGQGNAVKKPRTTSIRESLGSTSKPNNSVVDCNDGKKTVSFLRRGR